MSKPWKHALSSAKKFGGKPEDYLPIHDFFDSTKACLPDVRHRAILHSAFGIFIAEKVFGHNIKNSDGKLVSVRDIGEQHCIEDLGTIPTLQDWLRNLPIESWMSRPSKKVENIDVFSPDKEDKQTNFPGIPSVPVIPLPFRPNTFPAPGDPPNYPLMPAPTFPNKLEIMD